MNPRAASLMAVILCCLAAGAALAGPPGEPRDWLDRMSATMSQMSYQGTFVYIQGERLETMRITHLVGEDGVRERLVAMSGPQREVLRDSNGVRWVLGKDSSILEDSAFKRSFFPGLPLDQMDQDANSYTLKFGKEGRVAGQKARNIKIVPRDTYRYGYSLWLDVHTGMLLKWELVGSDRKSLAKLMFTDIRIGAQVDPAELKPSHHLKEFKTVASELPAGHSGSLKSPRWKPQKLPPGFRLNSHRTVDDGKNGAGVYEHFVFSDGLAAVSVYVESSAAGPVSQNLHRHGTMHAFTRRENGLVVTVIGDVPAATVKLIGKNINMADR